MGLYAQLGMDLVGNLNLGVRFMSSIGSTSFDIDEGRLEYRLRTAMFVLRYDFKWLRDRLVLTPEIGLGALQVSAESFPNRSGTTVVDVTSFTGAPTNRWAYLGQVQVSTAWHLSPYLAVVGAAGTSFFAPEITFEGITKEAGASPVTTSYRQLGSHAFVAGLGLRVRF